ncbi:MAG: hypothetical protein K8T90_04325 [Planctomycetes bacterium]|nr:hypothetical protein [Planctomycetota bacterium]
MSHPARPDVPARLLPHVPDFGGVGAVGFSPGGRVLLVAGPHSILVLTRAEAREVSK